LFESLEKGFKLSKRDNVLRLKVNRQVLMLLNTIERVSTERFFIKSCNESIRISCISPKFFIIQAIVQRTCQAQKLCATHC